MAVERGSRHSGASLVGALAAASLLALTLCPRAAADEISDLRAENARLRAENEGLRAELEMLQAAGSPRGGSDDRAGGAGTAAGGTTSKSFETTFVPRTRLVLEVNRDQSSGVTSVSTPWYRTAESSLLPRKEWIRFGARETAGGAFDGAWILLERRGGRASLESVGEGRLSIDGRVLACPVASYDVSRKRQLAGRSFETVHDERVRFAVPGEALALLPRATSARFEAGTTGFPLSDEHLAGAAAVAQRVQPPTASSLQYPPGW